MNHHDKLTLSIEDRSDSFVVSLVEEDGDQEDEDVTALASQNWTLLRIASMSFVMK